MGFRVWGLPAEDPPQLITFPCLPPARVGANHGVLGFWGVGFRVLGFRVQGLGFRVESLGFRV